MFPELQTDRLLLTKILPGDQRFVFEGLSHPEVIPFYGVRYETFEATAAQMAFYDRLESEGSGIAWKMVEKETGRPIGVLAVYLFKPEHGKAEIGFWLLPPFWGKGYAKEALLAAVSYWQTEKGLHRIEGFVEEENRASWGLLERCGFSYEGTMRDCERKDGRWISLRIYALIQSESM